MEQSNADTVIMLSSELIAEVMEGYFNKAMFKKKVKIVDLQPTGTGYAFSLIFVQHDKQTTSELWPVGKTLEQSINKDEQEHIRHIIDGNGNIQVQVGTRDNKGRFVKKRDRHVTTTP